MVDVGPVEFTVNCAVHGDERRVTPFYTNCLECGHVFQTADELVEADLELRRWLATDQLRVPIEPPVARFHREITVCPHCVHDL